MKDQSRSAQEILDDLGQRLDSGYRAPRRRRVSLLTHRSRIAAIVVLFGVLCVSAAAATQTVFSPAPPLPRLSRVAVDLGAGQSGGISWQLTVARCSAPAGSFSLLLATSAGGAGSACSALPSAPSTWLTSKGSLVFGDVPAAAARVELTFGARHRDLSVIPVDRVREQAGRLPSISIYVTVMPAGATVTALTAFDAEGHLLIACNQRSCSKP